MARERSPLARGHGTEATAEPLVEGGAAGDEALAARGDADAFIQLYRRHLPAVYRYAYARTGNRQDAEDVTALAFERAWAALPRYRATGSFRGWLFTIAQRALADHRRRRRPETVPVEALAEVLPDPASGPEGAALAAEELRLALHLLGGLGRAQQKVLALRFFASLRYDEIATVLGMREPAVKMLAYRALDALRRRYPDARP